MTAPGEILQRAREAAAVPASSLQGGDACKELLAEKKLIEMENRLIQSEHKLREAQKELARLYGRDAKPLQHSVETQTTFSATVPETQVHVNDPSPLRVHHHKREGSKLLTNSDFKTFKKFVKRVYSRFNPKADPDEFVKKWAGRESEGVVFIQQTFGLSSMMITDLCRDGKPAVKKSVRRTASPSPLVKREISKTMEKPKKKVLPTPPPPPSPLPVQKGPKLKLTQNNVVLISDPLSSETHRGTYLGKDDRGLCCVQVFGSGDVTRYHPANIQPEAGSNTVNRKQQGKVRQDVFYVQMVSPTPIVGDEVTLQVDGCDSNQHAVIAARDVHGKCLVVFAANPKQPVSRSPARDRMRNAPIVNPAEPAVEMPQEMWATEDKLTIVRFSTSSKGPAAIHAAGTFDF
eukprot:TRINITY_DN38107_c0_g1_i1.p1 TRINITY_DN38107_c0_g1~~TRINITY_DN38107_c0_g1_i1.p1  ORF type:complete len:420 (+),score=47.86 TRINITY_DN38107_c0_g1_i1:50-1261(+)